MSRLDSLARETSLRKDLPTFVDLPAPSSPGAAGELTSWTGPRDGLDRAVEALPSWARSIRQPANQLAQPPAEAPLVDVNELMAAIKQLNGFMPFDPKKAAEAKKKADANTQVAAGGPGDVSVWGFHHDDVKQGGLGDCYLLAALASLCDADGAAIDRMIANEQYENGILVSCDVRLFAEENGRLVEKWIKVDCREFGKYAAKVGDVDPRTGVQELWPRIIEKAFAQLNPDFYYGIGQGAPVSAAMRALTGKDAGATPIASYGFDQLLADVNAGKLISFETARVYDQDGNVIPGREELAKRLAAARVSDWHAFSVVNARIENGVPMVQLYNPWGHTQPGSGDSDGGWMTFEEAQKLFAGATVGAK